MFAFGSHVSSGAHRKLIAGALGAIALSSLVSFWMWTRTPQYAIRQIEKAIKVHDIQRFRKYVDLDGVAADLLALVQLNAADSGALGSAVATTMAGQLEDAVKRTLTTMVESQGAGPPRIVYQFIDLESSYAGIEYVKRDGKLAVAGLEFTTPTRATKARVYEIRMRDLGSHWQIAGLNLSQIVVVKSLRDAEELRRLEAEHAEQAETRRAARQEAESERAAARQTHAELTAKAASSLSMSLGERAVVGGLPSGVWATMALSQPAFDDIDVAVLSDSKAASTPSLVTIPKGVSSVKFLVETLAVKIPVETRITAQAYGTERTVTLLIEPRPVPPPEKHTAYENVFLDERAREYHVSTCEAAKAAAKGQPPKWLYISLRAQGIPRAKDCANVPLPILNQQPPKR